ncbi:hypothetical protein HDU81_005697 [Chytriomyces hyalinus]|nr:hypothetical protein HDU81_005697 [Chytriomyces hyalinus]
MSNSETNAGTSLKLSNAPRGNDDGAVTPNSPDSVNLSAFHGGAIGSLRMSSMMDDKADAPLKQAPSTVPSQQANNMKAVDARGGVKAGANASVKAEDVRGSRSGSLHMSQTLFEGQQAEQTNASQNGNVHGDQAGSLSMSDKLSNFRQQNSGISDDAGANKVSNAPNNDFADVHTTTGGSIAMSNKLSNAPKQANNDFVGMHAAQGGAVDMSAKLANANKTAPPPNNDFAESLTNQVGSIAISDKIASMGPPRSFSDSDAMEDVLKALASDYGWDATELAEDVASFKRNRVKNVKQARDLSDHAWNEMADVLPTTKDLVRTAIGRIQH